MELKNAIFDQGSVCGEDNGHHLLCIRMFSVLIYQLGQQ